MFSQSKVLAVPPSDISQCIAASTNGSGFGMPVWTWCLTPDVEAWWGVPVVNYLTWFLLVFGYSLVLDAAVRWYNPASLPCLKLMAALSLRE